MKTVWIYINGALSAGNANHVVVFANFDAAEAWFEANDEEAVAFEYPVIEIKNIQ